jgi:hypothetical protein
MKMRLVSHIGLWIESWFLIYCIWHIWGLPPAFYFTLATWILSGFTIGNRKVKYPDEPA